MSDPPIGWFQTDQVQPPSGRTLVSDDLLARLSRSACTQAGPRRLFASYYKRARPAVKVLYGFNTFDTDGPFGTGQGW